MVVLAGLVGAGGLGAEVTRGLMRMETGLGLRAGLSIVAVALLLDRLVRGAPVPVVAQLAVLAGSDVSYVGQVAAPRAPTTVVRIGVRLPAHLTATGRAMLAALPPAQVRALFPHRDSLITRRGVGPRSLPELDRILADVRVDDVATEDGEITAGYASVAATGIDPTPKLIEAARSRDDKGRYVQARAEALPLPDSGFDLVVSYLTLIDIDDIRAAIAEMGRVLRPGGSLLVANLNSFSTAGGWNGDPGTGYLIDNYLDERAEWVSWRGILIRNWHRPFHAYMQALLAQGLRLVHFDEPTPQGGDPERVARYRRAPYLHLMEWVRD